MEIHTYKSVKMYKKSTYHDFDFKKTYEKWQLYIFSLESLSIE